MESFLTSIYAGDDVSRPTFLELVYQEQLCDFPRPAIQVLVRGWEESAPPWLVPLLARWEALYSGAVLLLQLGYLRGHAASLSEHFCGLRRQQAAPRRRLSMLEEVELQRQRMLAPGLAARQQLASLVALVLLPWVRQLLEARWREVAASGARSAWQLLLLRLYPAVHGVSGTVALAYKVLYMLGQTDIWSPSLHLLGLRLVRHFPDPAGLDDAEPKGKLVRIWGALSAGWSASLWGAAYAMQFAQWWFAREHLLQPYRPRRVPPPPPPRPPYAEDAPVLAPAAAAGPGGPGAPAAEGWRLVLLPQDRTVCPLCHRVRRNPAVSCSGYAFCYPCLVPHVQRHGHCPVTGVPMAVEQIRRIRDDAEGAG